jgi:Lon protease-like protein
VLCPGGLLPLRIFEVRYLDMIGRSHKAGTPFGVVCMTAGHEVQQPAAPAPRTPPPLPSSPPAPAAKAPANGAAGAAGPTGTGAGSAYAHEAFQSVGTLAHIVQLDRPQPGLMMIRCVGGSRFRIESSEKSRHGLWVANATALAPDAEVSVPDDLASVRATMQQLLASLERQGNTAEMPVLAPYRWDDCGWLANRWCELLPLAPAVKHRLMALDNPLLRLELVADLLERMGVRGSPTSGP